MIRELIAAQSAKTSLAKNILQVLAGVFFIFLGQEIFFYLPYNPVPITFQLMAVLLLAVCLGKNRAASAVCLYAGMQFFMGFRPLTYGYILSMILSAYFTGWIAHAGKRTLLRVLSAMFVGSLSVYLIGLPWLACFVGFSNAFKLGMLPFLLLDGIRLCVGALIITPLLTAER